MTAAVPVLRVLAVGVALALPPSVALAQLRCTEQRVEYLVGGAAGARGRMCAKAPPSHGAPREGGALVEPGRAAGHTPVIVRPDDDGRREILHHELGKEREALLRLQAADAAMGADAQSAAHRHQGNIRALEAELRRLPPAARARPH